MNKVKMSIESNKILEDSAKLIFDEITQNLCLAKLTLSLNKSDKAANLKEKINTSHELVSNSIRLLRKVGESLNEIRTNIQSK